MDKVYRYTVEGSGNGGKTWKTEGSMTCAFEKVWLLAMADTFNQLTDGKAQYGQPGVGCQGPYDIHKVVIEQVMQ